MITISKYPLTPLEVKVRLLYYGLRIPPKILEILKDEPGGWSWGRSTGAGPAGGRYFELINPPSQTQVLINVPLQSQFGRDSPFLVSQVHGPDFSVNDSNGRHIATLRLLPIPAFGWRPGERKHAKDYALLHGKDCLATTVNQRCKYWREGHACRYCGVELSLDAGTTVAIKSSRNLQEVLELALAEVPVTHVTLTSGTQADASRGISQYIPIVRDLKKNHPNIKIHAQFEPPLDDDYIFQLQDVGCDTVGIHVEITDDDKRLECCPGKGQIPWERYTNAWRAAVKAFGRNQVDSYLLLGLEPFSDNMLGRISEICEIGVIPYPVPVRKVPGTDFTVPGMDIDSLVKVHRNIARIMTETAIDPSKNLAGCVRCSACSAISEALNEQLPLRVGN